MSISQLAPATWNLNFSTPLIGEKKYPNAEKAIDFGQNIDLQHDVALDGRCVSFGCVA